MTDRDNAIAALRTVAEAINHHKLVLETLRDRRRHAITTAHRLGISYADIGRALGVTRQRAADLTNGKDQTP